MGSRLRLIIDPEAQKEINNAIDCYESTKEGLGKNFIPTSMDISKP